MNTISQSKVNGWLQAEWLETEDTYCARFAEHHLGNTFIRSLHGGVTATLIEMSAEHTTHRQYDGSDPDLMIASSTVDYLRVTKDEDLYARSTIVRISRRLSIVDVICWQDSEDTPVARGTVCIRISTAPEAT